MIVSCGSAAVSEPSIPSLSSSSSRVSPVLPDVETASPTVPATLSAHENASAAEETTVQGAGKQVFATDPLPPVRRAAAAASSLLRLDADKDPWGWSRGLKHHNIVGLGNFASLVRSTLPGMFHHGKVVH